MPQQLAFPFARDDEADALARMLTARIVTVIQSMATPEFRWTPGADLAISRVREAIAADLRELLQNA